MALGYPCIYLIKERRSEKEKDKCHPCYNVILCYVQTFTGKQNYFLQEILLTLNFRNSQVLRVGKTTHKVRPITLVLERTNQSTKVVQIAYKMEEKRANM